MTLDNQSSPQVKPLPKFSPANMGMAFKCEAVENAMRELLWLSIEVLHVSFEQDNEKPLIEVAYKSVCDTLKPELFNTKFISEKKTMRCEVEGCIVHWQQEISG